MKLHVPASIIATMPNTRWCTWTPLSETTLPGHQGTFGLRISRVDRRMKPNDARNDRSTRNRYCRSRSWKWSQMFSKIVAVVRAHRRASIPARPPRGKPGTDASAAASSATQTPKTSWAGRWKLPLSPSSVALANPTATKP